MDMKMKNPKRKSPLRSIRSYQRALLSVFLIVVIFNAVFGIMIIWRVTERYTTLIEMSYKQSAYVNELEKGYTKMLLELHDFVFQGKKSDNLENLYLQLAEVKTVNQLIVSGSEKLAQTDVNESERMAVIQSAIVGLEKLIDNLVVISRSGSQQEAEALLMDAEDNQLAYLSYNIKLYMKEQKQTLNGLNNQMTVERNYMLVYLVFVNAIILGIFYYVEMVLGRVIYKPILTLSRHMGSLDPDALGTPLEEDWHNQVKEMRMLGDAAEEMRKRLKEAFGKISEQNEVLEEKVQVRTTELSRMNVKLQDTLDDLQETQKNLIGVKRQEVVNHLVKNLLHRVNSPLGTAIVSLDYVLKEMQEDDRSIAESGVTKSRGVEIQGCEATSVLNSEYVEHLGITMTSLKRIRVIMDSLKRMLDYNESEKLTDVASMQVFEAAFIEVFGSRSDSNRLIYIEEIMACVIRIKAESLKKAFVSLFTFTVEQRQDKQGIPPARIRTFITGNAFVVEYYDESLKSIEDSHGNFDPYSYANFQTNDTGLEMVILHNLVTMALNGTVTLMNEQDGVKMLKISIPVESGV